MKLPSKNTRKSAPRKSTKPKNSRILGLSKGPSRNGRAKKKARRTPRVVKPYFDKDRRTLSYQGEIVKHFKVPAPLQVLILTAFQELGWPPRIDDPLPHVTGKNPKTRLHDAVNSLNDNQQKRLLHFHADGTGQGITWEALR